MFFLKQLFIKAFVNSDRESRSSSDDSSRDDNKDETLVEVDAPYTTFEFCLPND